MGVGTLALADKTAPSGAHANSSCQHHHPFGIRRLEDSFPYLSHGLAHCRRRPCDCVAAQVNHLCAQQLPRASMKEALLLPMPLNAAVSCTELSVYWTHMTRTQSNAADGAHLTAW